MKKIIAIIFLLTIVRCVSYEQDLKFKSDTVGRDSILRELETARQDTTRVLLIAKLAGYYRGDLPDSALFYGYKALALARQIKFLKRT